MIIIGNWKLQLTVSKENCLEKSCSKPSFYFSYFRFYFNISQFISLCLVCSAGCSDINFAVESLFMAMERADEGKTDFITLDVLKQMLEIQERSYRSMISMLTDDIKLEIRSLKKDVEDLKVSLQFSQAQFDDHKKTVDTVKSKMEEIDDRVKYLESYSEDTYNLENRCEEIEEKQEYLENMSRRNNIKVLDLPEEEGEKTWADTEELVKKTVKEQLHYEDDVHIERAHRMGKPRPLFVMNSDGTKTKSRPRLIARFSSWKEKEAILATARKVKPKQIKFFQDLSSRTLKKRAEKIPDLIRERKKGKITYFILDRLIVREKNEGKG